MEDMLMTWTTVLAVAIAGYQVYLQRRETERNSKMHALIHLADVLKARIAHYERIIYQMKVKKVDWSGHARKANNEFLPMLIKVQSELYALLACYEVAFDDAELKSVLGLESS